MGKKELVNKSGRVEFSTLNSPGGKVLIDIDDLNLVKVSNGRLALTGKADDGVKVFQWISNKDAENIKDKYGKRVHNYKKSA